jgi:hypothetical protein
MKKRVFSRIEYIRAANSWIIPAISAGTVVRSENPAEGYIIISNQKQ